MSSPEEQRAVMIASVPEKTGRTLDEWRQHLASHGLEAHGKIVAHLKKEHGVTHGYANLVAHLVRESPSVSSAEPAAAGDDLIEAQYQGKRAAIRPIYDAVIERVRGFGEDVELAPKKAYMSLRRSTQFGVLQPTTTRLDVGIKLPDVEPAGRLEASGSFNSMVSHRVRVSSVDEVDDELMGWLERAYDRA